MSGDWAQVLICQKCKRQWINALETWTPEGPYYICVKCRTYTLPKEHCSNGHALVGANLIVDNKGLNHCRRCRIDQRHTYSERQKVWREASKKTPKPKVEKKPKTHCINGHEYTPENTYVSPGSGRRSCRACTRDRIRAWRELRKGVQFDSPTSSKGPATSKRPGP